MPAGYRFLADELERDGHPRSVPTRHGSPTSPSTRPPGKLYCCAVKDLFSNRIVGYEPAFTAPDAAVAA